MFTNTKNKKNGDIYEKILSVLKERAAKRGEVIEFTVAELRNKFKKCILMMNMRAQHITFNKAIKTPVGF